MGVDAFEKPSDADVEEQLREAERVQTIRERASAGAAIAGRLVESWRRMQELESAVRAGEFFPGWNVTIQIDVDGEYSIVLSTPAGDDD